MTSSWSFIFQHPCIFTSKAINMSSDNPTVFPQRWSCESIILKDDFIGDRRHCGPHDCNNELDFSAAVRMPAFPTFSLRRIEIWHFVYYWAVKFPSRDAALSSFCHLRTNPCFTWRRGRYCTRFIWWETGRGSPIYIGYSKLSWWSHCETSRRN